MTLHVTCGDINIYAPNHASERAQKCKITRPPKKKETRRSLASQRLEQDSWISLLILSHQHLQLTNCYSIYLTPIPSSSSLLLLNSPHYWMPAGMSCLILLLFKELVNWDHVGQNKASQVEETTQNILPVTFGCPFWPRQVLCNDCFI